MSFPSRSREGIEGWEATALSHSSVDHTHPLAPSRQR